MRLIEGRTKVAMTRFQAIVTDIDGTLTNKARHISVHAIEALRNAESLGYPVILASGNVLPIAYGLRTFLGLSGPIVAENGGVVFHNDQVHVLCDMEKALAGYELLKAKYGAERVLTDQWRLSEVGVKENFKLDLAKAELEPLGLRVESTGYAFHILEKKASKFNGVKRACELAGIDISSVVAFGDSGNDIEMLAGCGMGIAVANAIPDAKKAADYVCKNENGSGIREGLEEAGIL